MELLGRISDPVTSTPRRATFTIHPEGESWMPRDLTLSFAVTATLQAGKSGQQVYLPANAGAWAFIRSVRVRGENGTQLFKLDEVPRFASVKNLEYRTGMQPFLDVFLDGSQVSAVLGASQSLRKRLPSTLPAYGASADTTRAFSLPIARVCNCFPALLPLWKSGPITIEVDLQLDHSKIFVDNLTTVASYTITDAQLNYDLLQSPDLTKRIGSAFDVLEFNEPLVGQQRLAAVAAGVRQSASLSMGFAGSQLSSLTVAIVADSAADSVSTANITTAGTGIPIGSTGAFGNVPPAVGTGATYLITGVSAAGGVTSFKLLHGGSGYAVNDILAIPSGDGAGRVTVTAIGDSPSNLGYRSDGQNDLVMNVKVNGTYMYPEAGLKKAGLLRELSRVQGRLSIPPGAYQSTAPAATCSGISGGKGEMDYLASFMRGTVVGEQGLDLQIQRTGGVPLMQQQAATVYAFGAAQRMIPLASLAKAR